MSRRGAKAEISVAAAMVRVDTLRNFSAVVTQLGGDPKILLREAGIDPEIVSNRHAVIPHLALVKLLKQTSTDLRTMPSNKRRFCGWTSICPNRKWRPRPLSMPCF
jgi:hypothetical protein